MTRVLTVALMVGLACLTTSCVLLRPAATTLLGEARVRGVELAPGAVSVPASQRDPERYASAPDAWIPESGHVRDLVERWAARELPDWEEEGKVTAPRVILAKLALGVDIPAINSYLLEAEPWAGIGSTWSLRKSGDYDFSLPPLTAMLYHYGDDPDRLYPETVDHLINVLLNQEGDRFLTTVPGSLRLVAETENHILMTEGSRYLKNQWLVRHGSTDPRHDNTSNGLREKLVDYIHEIDRAGAYEFNSTPYMGYTLMALLTLDAFADEQVASVARAAIDRINFEYALSSYGFRRYAPYRRQRRRSGRTDLTDHPHTSMMRTWANLDGEDWSVENNDHQAVYAALMPYRLPPQTLSAATRGAGAPDSWYARIGRGPGASPGIYSAGPGFLLSAGGIGRPPLTQIVARPITLFLNDGAEDLSELFSIAGSGSYEEWNNTGVIDRFAVGRSPLAVPESFSAVQTGDTWRVFVDPAGSTLIGAADTGSTASLYLEPIEAGTDTSAAAAELLDRLEMNAAGDDLDSGLVRLPDERLVAFDLEVDRDTWVISALDGAAVDREVTAWPRMSGDIAEGE